MLSKKIAAVVILYCPDKNVRNNVESYANDMYKLYLIDNTDKGVSKEALSIVENMSHVELLHSGFNIGIAAALNLALDKAKEDRIEWLMTMDQDSAFEKNDLSIFIEHLHTVSNDPHILLLSPLHQKKHLVPCVVPSLKRVEIVMTSANLVHVERALEIGGYDESLFIDEVDHEFCLRAKAKGYTVWLDYTVAIDHVLGEKYKTITRYPEERIYYMIRNYLAIRKRFYHENRSFFKKRDRYLIGFFWNQFLYARSKKKVLRMMLAGLRDYRGKQCGKRIDG